VAADLENKDFNVTVLQGNLSQNKRNMAINGFKNGKYDIMVATDIASRGIDVSEVSHVINFDMPSTVDAYIHRIGRTGRAKNKGEALTFVVPDDESMVRSIEKILNAKIDRRTIDEIDYGKTNVKGSNANEHREPNVGSKFKRHKKRIYNDTSGTRRHGKKIRTSSNNHRSRKNLNSNNSSGNSNDDTGKTRSDNRTGSKWSHRV